MSEWPWGSWRGNSNTTSSLFQSTHALWRRSRVRSGSTLSYTLTAGVVVLDSVLVELFFWCSFLAGLSTEDGWVNGTSSNSKRGSKGRDVMIMVHGDESPSYVCRFPFTFHSLAYCIVYTVTICGVHVCSTHVCNIQYCSQSQCLNVKRTERHPQFHCDPGTEKDRILDIAIHYSTSIAGPCWLFSAGCRFGRLFVFPLYPNCQGNQQTLAASQHSSRYQHTLHNSLLSHSCL